MHRQPPINGNAAEMADGSWHHVESYKPDRATRPDTVRLWHKLSTEEVDERVSPAVMLILKTK